MSVSRSELDFSFSVFGCSCEKAVIKRKANKWKTKDQVKKVLIRSLQETEVLKSEGLNELAEKVTNHAEVIPVVQDYYK